MGNHPSNVDAVGSQGGDPSRSPGNNQRNAANMSQRQQQQVAHMMQGQGQGQGQSQFGPGYGQPQQPRSNMQQNSSDASMASNSQTKQSTSSGTNNANAATPAVHVASVNDPAVQANIAQLSAVDDDVVPTVFRWEHGGRDVYITGTFNNWTKQIPMHRSGNDFTYIHNLKRGKHAFKFIVDDEWRYAPDQPTVADIEGRINNFIDVTDFKAYTGDKSFETEKNAAYYATNGKMHNNNHNHNHNHDANMAMREDEMPMASDASPQLQDPDGETFTHTMPDLDEYTKDPPPLPPHLRHIILNKPPQLQDTAALPVPQHVALNHLYCTAIRDNMMVLGITQRYQTKFVTTVYYSPELNRT